MQWKVDPGYAHVVAFPQPLNTHGTEIAPGSYVVGEDLEGDRVAHRAILADAGRNRNDDGGPA